MVIQERLSKVIKLYYGAHAPDGEMCLMEAVAYVAGEEWSDHPACVDVALAAYGRKLNDDMPDDRRQALIPLIASLVGTNQGDALTLRRAYFFADRAVRLFAPRALDAAGLSAEAARLRALPTVVDVASAERAARAAWEASAAWVAESAARAASAASAERAAWVAERAASAARAAWDAAVEVFSQAIEIS